MNIRELQMHAFGKFHDRCINLQEDVNIIEGRNEAGKSTIHAFIGAVLLGIKTPADEKKYKRYKPWFGKGRFGGSITFTEKEKVYFLERNFTEGTVGFTLVGSGETLTGEEAEAELKRVLGGISVSGYENTVCISQMKGTTDETIAKELENNLENLSRARSMSLDFKGAEERLKDRKADIERRLAAIGQDTENAGKKKELEKKLSEISAMAWKAKDELAGACELKKQAFERYEERREGFNNRREMLDYEQDNLERLAEQWNSTDGKYKKLLQEKEKRIEELRQKGKDPVGAFAPALYPFFIIMAIAALAAFVLFYLYYLPEGEAVLYFSAYGCVIVAVACLVIALIKRSRFKKKQSYYRLLIDRKNRQKEYAKDKKRIEQDRARLLTEMSDEQNGEYINACAFADRTGSLYNEIRKQAELYAAELDAAKVSYNAYLKETEKQKKLLEEKEAVCLALEHLYRAGEISVKSFGGALTKKAGEYLSVVTEGKYTEIVYNEENLLCLKGVEKDVPVAAVSRGTMEQVYLCIRLAASELLPTVRLPIMLDDTFAYYDDDRTIKALRLLMECGHQVIIMTCQSREKKMLEEIRRAGAGL